uniref:F-box domain-containing protein n=1 Tax=Aegilops tauschii subsp. strangulata TaxID=200361 RepID=A0A453NJ92_AEGTS
SKTCCTSPSAMAEECCSADLLEWIGPDVSACVFSRLDHPADLVRAAAVSRTWRRCVVESGLSKSLCLRLCPEVATVAAAAEVSRSPPSTAAPESGYERDYRIYSNLAGAYVSDSAEPSAECILDCIGASSTDDFPAETMENTLDEEEIINFRPRALPTGSTLTSALSMRFGCDRTKPFFRMVTLYTLQRWCDFGWAITSFREDQRRL